MFNKFHSSITLEKNAESETNTVTLSSTGSSITTINKWWKKIPKCGAN